MVDSDRCRTVLQFFMLRRVMNVEFLTDVVKRVTGSDDIDHIIDEINEGIQEFSQKIVKSTCEVTGDKVYVMTNTADEAGVASQLTKAQVDYFYILMDKIITSSGILPVITALNLASSCKTTVTLSEAEKYIELFAVKRLLILERGHLYLSPLTIAELGPYLAENYELDPCMLCKKMLVYGDSCKSCNTPIHVQCLKDFVTNSKRTVKCPQCKAQMNET